MSGLLPKACLGTFLRHPRTICPEMALPIVAGLSHINGQSRKCPMDTFSGQFDGDIPQFPLLRWLQLVSSDKNEPALIPCTQQVTTVTSWTSLPKYSTAFQDSAIS